METIIGLAALGGLIVNLLQLMEYAKIPKTDRPDFKDWLFWLPYFVWPILAGVLGYAYQASGNNLSPILALNVGVSAPLIFRAMVEVNPFASSSINPGEGA